MTDHIDTAAEREKLAALDGFTPGPWDAHGLTVYDTCMDGVASCHANADARLIAAAPDLLTLAHNLLDALDAERALTQRATDGWSKVQDAQIDALARAEKAEAERDQALARLAVAYEVAAQDVEEWREEDGETTYDAIAGSIRALIPADAAEALQRGVDATWNKAVEAAAKAASMDGVTPHTPWANGYAAACRENAADILALKRPEASHE